MAKYDISKKNIFGGFPQKVGTTQLGAAGFNRVEPFLTVERLKKEFLFGIPLIHPYTKQVLDDDTLKNLMNRAASRIELECKIDVFPVQRVRRSDFDRTKYLQGYNQIDLSFKNVQSVEELSIRAVNNSPSNSPGNEDGTVFYQFPLEWVDLSYADRGILHLVPLQTTFNSTGIVGGATTGPAAAIFAVFSRLAWIPSFFYIRFTTGFQENSIPAPINDLIGVITALDVLSMLAPLNKFQSQSIGIDGISQGVSGPGVQVYAQRYNELTQKRNELMDLIKHRFGNAVVMSNI